MNNKGFTLVELIGSMVILGLIMLLVVPNVVGLLNSSRETVYVEDAKKLVLIAKAKVSGKKINIPMADGQCVFLGLGYIENSEFDNPPNGGCYDVNRSFEVIKKENYQLKYYVKLVEYYDRKYNGIIDLTESTALNKDVVKHGEASDNLKFTYDTGSFANTSICSGGYISGGVYTKNGPKTYKEDGEGMCARP